MKVVASTIDSAFPKGTLGVVGPLLTNRPHSTWVARRVFPRNVLGQCRIPAWASCLLLVFVKGLPVEDIQHYYANSVRIVSIAIDSNTGSIF